MNAPFPGALGEKLVLLYVSSHPTIQTACVDWLTPTLYWFNELLNFTPVYMAPYFIMASLILSLSVKFLRAGMKYMFCTMISGSNMLEMWDCVLYSSKSSSTGPYPLAI